MAVEVQLARRVSGDLGLEGAVREYERKRRHMAESAGEKIGKKHARRFVLSVLLVLEYEVLEDRQPLFVRVYAWHRLLRHLSSWTYSDAEG